MLSKASKGGELSEQPYAFCIRKMVKNHDTGRGKLSGISRYITFERPMHRMSKRTDLFLSEKIALLKNI